MSMHESQVILVRCADDNYSEGKPLSQGLKNIVEHESAQIHYELNSFGGALGFVLPETKKAWEWRFEVARTLKPSIKRIIAINHSPNCGAVNFVYGPFDNEEAEKAKHVELLRLGMDFVRDNAPGVEYVGYLQEGDNFTKICEFIPQKENVENFDQQVALA